MNKSSYIVASRVDWNSNFFNQFSKQHKGAWYFASNPVELEKLLKTITPRYIFFPHWSWIVSDEIIDEYECICFHMTDLRYGRGGSPLQNLIIQGFKETKLTALRMEKDLDAGPIYYKKSLNLCGSASDIYKRSGKLCWNMISDFVKDNPIPTPQRGVITSFKRRSSDESLIPKKLPLEDIYNYIRMLDAPGYPKAFIEIEDYRLEFESSSFSDGKLSAKVSFIKMENDV